MLFYMSEEGQEVATRTSSTVSQIFRSSQASVTDVPGPYRRWVLAARPRTLPAALVPVFVGAALVRPASINWLNSALCVVVALALQIGTNFANDYSDGIRGTDEVRVGHFVSRLQIGARLKGARVAVTWFLLAGFVGLWFGLTHVVVVGARRIHCDSRWLVLHGWPEAVRLLWVWRAFRNDLLRFCRDRGYQLRAAPHDSVLGVVVWSGHRGYGLRVVGS